ncbi:class II fructose-bisphosphate aldolase [Candidatus Uhrbacteria bacterium]|nr:class II fructose-bisphosphate aldolase [Candidatus Uhrbacteria bacterium]
MTRPEDARRFVKETGCDTLAVSIGTKHGIRKFFSANARLDIKRLQLIQKNVSVPLVLHGASSLPSHVKDVAEQYGADLSHAYGVSKVQLKQAIQHGISKINTDSDLRIAFSGAVDRAMTRRPNNLDPRSYLGEGRAAVARIVESKLALFGAAHRV